MIVEVTRADIKQGVAGSYSSCPIALALKRYFPKKYVHVGFPPWLEMPKPNVDPEGAIVFGLIKEFKNYKIYRAALQNEKEPITQMSMRVIKFVKNFDAGKKVKPFRFVLPAKAKSFL